MKLNRTSIERGVRNVAAGVGLLALSGCGVTCECKPFCSKDVGDVQEATNKVIVNNYLPQPAPTPVSTLVYVYPMPAAPTATTKPTK